MLYTRADLRIRFMCMLHKTIMNVFTNAHITGDCARLQVRLSDRVIVARVLVFHRMTNTCMLV